MFDFDQIDFEHRYFQLITEDVNAIFSDLLRSGVDDVQKEGLQTLRQIMESLHAITEEAVMQAVYGSLAHKENQL